MRICNLDEVVFLPERSPRSKHNVTDVVHRLALIERATETTAGLRVLDLVSERFTIKDTLPELCDIYANTHFTFLMGSDLARTLLYRWDNLGRLFNTASLAIGMRARDDPSEIAAIMDKLVQEYDVTINYTLVNTLDADIASSQIRNGTADTSRIQPTVLDYIIEHNLYAQAAE
jgi:nicotinate (nicotinamide) nucleotide adenylyltransferase